MWMVLEYGLLDIAAETVCNASVLWAHFHTFLAAMDCVTAFAYTNIIAL